MIDIVLQGALNEYAVEVANHYAELDFVNRIILSCWQGDPYILVRNEKTIVLRNERVDPGVGNRNLQIKSSHEGLKFCQTNVSVKMRNDQKVSHDSMKMMYEYYSLYSFSVVNKIFVAGIFPTFPFHPRDHIFWGWTSNLKLLFNIPTDDESLSDDYTKYMRSEAYICMWYYAKFSDEAANMVWYKEDYLLDNSPRRNEAIELTKELDLFKPFPKIDFEWPKYGMKSYHYQYTKDVYGEYQADTIS